MKRVNSIKTIKTRHKDNYIAIRKGHIYVINKKQGKFKVRQG